MNKNSAGNCSQNVVATSKIRPTQFVKYQSFDDYHNNYYDSEEEETEESQINNDDKTEKLNLNEKIKNITTLAQLIEIGKLPYGRFQPCNREDLSALKKVINPLQELDQLIGMESVKSQIIDQVLFYCQGLHKNANPANDSGIYMHTVIQGPPGCGKTTVATIIAKIYLKLGILASDRIVTAKRKDLIGEFLGSTAVKTSEVLESALGGVLFIDEAYSLGNNSETNNDMFSKECIDTINLFLSEHKHEIVVIIAGYEDQLRKCFFSANQGLERRFPWVYDIKNYKPTELKQIFIKQTRDRGWEFNNDNIDMVLPLELIKQNEQLFDYGGGDTENLLTKCQLAHSRNTFGLLPDKKKKLTKNDLKQGLERHIKNKAKKEKIPDLYI